MNPNGLTKKQELKILKEEETIRRESGRPRKSQKPKRRLVIIERKYCDDDRPSHAIIGGLVTSKTEQQLKLLWEKWREEVEYPDSDSQFIKWLVEKGYGKEPELDWEIATIAD